MRFDNQISKFIATKSTSYQPVQPLAQEGQMLRQPGLSDVRSLASDRRT